MRVRISLLTAALAAFAAACSNGSYGSAHVTDVVSEYPSARINLTEGTGEVSLPEGAAISADIQLVAVDGDNLSGQIESEDPSILQVSPSPTDANNYTFLGIKAGRTTVEILSGGVQVATVEATVTAPSDSVVSVPFEAGVTEFEDDGGVDGDHVIPDAGDDAG